RVMSIRARYRPSELQQEHYTRFFGAIQNRPALWDSGHADFCNDDITKKLWTEVATIASKKDGPTALTVFQLACKGYADFLLGMRDHWNSPRQMEFLKESAPIKKEMQYIKSTFKYRFRTQSAVDDVDVVGKFVQPILWYQREIKEEPSEEEDVPPQAVAAPADEQPYIRAKAGRERRGRKSKGTNAQKGQNDSAKKNKTWAEAQQAEADAIAALGVDGRPTTRGIVAEVQNKNEVNAEVKKIVKNRKPFDPSPHSSMRKGKFTKKPAEEENKKTVALPVVLKRKYTKRSVDGDSSGVKAGESSAPSLKRRGRPPKTPSAEPPVKRKRGRPSFAEIALRETAKKAAEAKEKETPSTSR
ncbi:hypothetical protein PMAYCL1PPCAC_31586, partial [Pristionchus mayeri]